MMLAGEAQRMRVPQSVPGRVESFCRAYGLRIPVLLAPMAGTCPPALSIAVAHAGGLGAGGALLMRPAEIEAWSAEVAAAGGRFQINLWIPDPEPVRDEPAERRIRCSAA